MDCEKGLAFRELQTVRDGLVLPSPVTVEEIQGVQRGQVTCSAASG